MRRKVMVGRDFCEDASLVLSACLLLKPRVMETCFSQGSVCGCIAETD